MWFTYVSKQKLIWNMKKKFQCKYRCKYSYLFEYWDNHAMVNLLKMGLLPNFQWFLSPFYISRQTLAATSGVHTYITASKHSQKFWIGSCMFFFVDVDRALFLQATYLPDINVFLEINFKKISWIILAITQV